MGSSRHGPSRRPRLPAVVAAGTAVALVAGCGGSSPDSGSASNAAESGVGAGRGTKVTVDESEFALKMSSMTLKAGTYTFVAKNVGQATHALEIEGPGVEGKETKDLAPGQSASLTVALREGSYELYCPVDGHEDKGMKMTLTVT